MNWDNSRVINELSQEKLFDQATGRLRKFIQEYDGDHINIALPGGRTVEGFLKSVLKNYSKEDFVKLKFYPLDEFSRSPQRSESNFDICNRVLYEPAIKSGLISAEQVYRYEFSKENFNSDIEALSTDLEARGGKFNFIMLGSGGGLYDNGSEDMGHVAAIFANREEVFLSKDNFYLEQNAPKYPQFRMTATPHLILRSDLIFGFIITEQKRNVLNYFLNDKISMIESPIKLIKESQNSYLYTDIGTN